VEEFRTEEEQVEALRRWWKENGASTLVAIAVALAGAFGWQGWQAHQEGQAEAASEIYQSMMQSLESGDSDDIQRAMDTAESLKKDFPSSAYAQFASLHLAAIEVDNNDLAQAEEQLRWVLGKADTKSDLGQVAQLRLARVLAASGDSEQALKILSAGSETYGASFSMARGDILLSEGRNDEAREAFLSTQLKMASNSNSNAAGMNLPSLQAKLQSLTPKVAAEPSPSAKTISELDEPEAAATVSAESASEAQE